MRATHAQYNAALLSCWQIEPFEQISAGLDKRIFFGLHFFAVSLWNWWSTSSTSFIRCDSSISHVYKCQWTKRLHRNGYSNDHRSVAIAFIHVFFSFPKIWSFFFNATSWTPHSCAKHKHDIRFSSNTIFKDNLSSFELSSLVAKSHHARSWYLVNESTTTITTATFKANLNVMSNGFLASLFGKWHVYSMFGLTLKFPS